MNYSQSLNPQKFNNLQSTHIPTYGSIRENQHPNQMRVSGRYGERSIPGSVFLSKNKSLDHIGNRAAYELGKSSQQQAIIAQQAHHPLPLYTYGQQCQPCNQQSYMLPVYYEQPMRVRQQWQRPLDPNVHQQQWRFVKIQDKGGIVKYVTRDEEMVETVGQSQWKEYYKGKKQSQPPVIVPQRQTKTCCTPVLFALLGFLALIGLVLGLVLLLNSHQATVPKQSYRKSATYVDPTPGQLTQQLSAVPIEQQTIITSRPTQIVSRPTYTQSITAQPKQTVQTQTPQTFISKLETVNTQPISMSYGYQTTEQNYNTVDYNNDYQIRPVTQPTVDYTYVAPQTNYQQATMAPQDVNEPTTQVMKGNYEFRVPEGYRIDESGMIVPIV